MRQICLGAKAFGVESRIISLSPTPEPRILNNEEGEVHRFKLDFEIAGCGFSWEALRHFRQVSEWADVIHYHFPWPFADVLHQFAQPDRPSLVTYHSDIVKQGKWLHFYRPLMDRFLGGVDAIVATSPNYVETSPVLQRFVQKTRVIPIGIDRDSYPAVDPARVEHWRGELGDDFFLFIGVLRYYKGLHVLLEALKGTSIQLAVVGSGLNENELKDFARSNKLDNVHFLGSLSEEDKVALLDLCLGLLLPSPLRSEAFGVALLEAAMFVKPQITCEIGTGTSYVNRHEETGLIVPPNDALALRRAIERMAHSPNERRQWGAQAYQRYRELFTARKMAQSYVDLYRELIARHRH